jgi:hypothetical protein
VLPGLGELPSPDVPRGNVGDRIEVDRLEEKIRRAKLHRLDGRRDFSVGGHHDHVGIRVRPTELLEQVQPVHAREADIDEGEIDLALFQPGDGVLRAGYPMD